MAQKKVLVVDDEPRIVDILRAYLEREGFQVLSAGTGAQALERVSAKAPDLVVLDLNLPDIDGIEVCRTIRKSSKVPIIMLTGRGEEIDKIIGLEIGADDYVTKPFSPREVVSRVKAVLRRQEPEKEAETMTVGDLVIDTGRYEARCRGQKLDLTTTEFKLLSALVRAPGRVFTRMQLLDAVQGTAYEGYDRTIDAHIKNLRHKIDSRLAEHDCRIETVRGVGYKFEVPDAR
ncbi:MAG: response regulator transcription factor [Chloroflexi bacterium]|nr:response regulator transcription factor [Chloroflexota bacterium]